MSGRSHLLLLVGLRLGVLVLPNGLEQDPEHKVEDEELTHEHDEKVVEAARPPDLVHEDRHTGEPILAGDGEKDLYA